jgi:hypothetical protein
MKPSRIAALLLAASLLGHGQGQLTVIRVHPSGPADPRTEITVTFDRPVSGGLDAIVDAASIFRIDPAVAGRVEWRDPVTLRFTPAVPLQPGASYAVTIAHTFEAMDGTRLRQPYTFRVSIEPARVLAGSPIGPHTKERFIPPQPVLSVLLTATAAPGLIAERSWIAMGTACGGGGGGAGERRQPQEAGGSAWNPCGSARWRRTTCRHCAGPAATTPRAIRCATCAASSSSGRRRRCRATATASCTS